MKTFKIYFLFSFAFFFGYLTMNAQVEETNMNDSTNIVDTANITNTNDESEEYAPDDEEKIIDLDINNQESQDIVSSINNIISQIQQLQEQDTLFSYYATYEYNPQITEFSDSKTAMKDIVSKFDVVKVKDEKDSNFSYVKETIFNSNQAWDYIYERLYNNEGKLVYFVRRYTTFNSGCAEVAFEPSDYYFNNNEDIIKKTYNIDDSHNNVLNIQICWMERESYDKFISLKDFLTENPIKELE